MDQLMELFRYTSLNSAELWELFPVIAISFLAVIDLILLTMKNQNSRNVTAIVSLLGVLVLFIVQITNVSAPELQILGSVLIFTPVTRVLALVSTGIGLCSLLLVQGQSKRENFLSEIYPLVLFSMAGMMLLSLTSHLIVTFIAIEIMSLAVYVLVGLQRTAIYSAEASLKYFILGGAASASLLYGAALIYGATGSFELPVISAIISGQQAVNTALLVIGGIFVLAGLLFKVGAFPFHFWIPDVYQGAAHSVTGFMSTGVKFAAFIPLIKITQQIYFILPGQYGQVFYLILWILAALTMVYANFAALAQYELKRLLAYSAIAHTGYLLAGVLVSASSNAGAAPLLIYLVFYAFSGLGAMAAVILLTGAHQKDVTFDDLCGIAEKRPYIALALSVFMLAMAGIPMTAGFIGKYLLLNNIVGQGETLLVVIAVLASLVSVYYYLRVIVFMYMKESKHPDRSVGQSLLAPALVAGIMLIATLQFGLFPRMLVSYIYKILH